MRLLQRFGGPSPTCLSGLVWPLRALPWSRFLTPASMLIGRGRGVWSLSIVRTKETMVPASEKRGFEGCKPLWPAGIRVEKQALVEGYSTPLVSARPTNAAVRSYDMTWMVVNSHCGRLGARFVESLAIECREPIVGCWRWRTETQVGMLFLTLFKNCPTSLLG